MHPSLAPYQVEAAGWLLQSPNRILADDMGLGKSFETIAACDLGGLRNVLILCPGTVRANWAEELQKWQTLPRTVCTIFSGKDIPDADVVICSYSITANLKLLKQLLSRKWDVLVLDEAHFAKNSTALRTRVIYGTQCDATKGLASVADRVWLLSGTLMPSNPSELWTHCHALFPEVSQGKGYDSWVRTYCFTAQDTGRIIGGKNTEELVGLLKPHVLRRLSKDVLPQLPPLRFSHVPVEPKNVPPLPPELEEAAFVIQNAIAKLDADPNDLDAKIELARLDTMHIASLRRWTGIAKAPAVAEYINSDFENGLDRIVVFGYHSAVLELLGQQLPDSYVVYGKHSRAENDDAIREFRFGTSIRSLVCQTDMTSTGIQLVSAANAAFAEPPWVPKDVEQAIKRLHRQGQTRNVFARMFSLRGSFDETVVRVLTRKMSLTKEFNDSIVQEV